MITEKIIEQIRQSKKAKAALQIALDRSAPTIQRYLDDNDIMLTTAAAVKAISEQLNIPETEILVSNVTA